jgi:uncharacterized protein (TIGR01244 family)
VRGRRQTAIQSSILEIRMLRRLILAAFVLGASTPALAAAQHFTSAEKITTLSAPVRLDTAGVFLARIARVGDDIFVGGQPTEQGLREMRAQGVTTVVNLRTPEEMTRMVKFDEPALVSQLGMKYLNLPVGGSAKYPYSPETVARFSQAVHDANGKVLLHCTVGWRASHLWGAYLIAERGVPVEDALANARAINLGDVDPRMPGRQPIEEFLNRSLPTLGHPPRD